jgi:hypothetical protein
MLSSELQNDNAVHILAEINERLKRMQPLSFSELSDYEQQLAFTIAINKASLGEVVERNETDPYIAELRRSEEQAGTQSQLERIKIACYDGLDELRKQVDTGALGAKVAKNAFEKSRRNLTP